MLVRCVYASRASDSLLPEALDRIMEQSRRNNPVKGITGLLCYTHDVFVQVIEGGRPEVCELYNTIVRDPRHVDVTLLAFEEIAERHFANWTMGKVNMENVNPALLLKYSAKPEVNPFRSSGKAIMAMLMELVATGAIASRTA
jgi:hypothetical protein